MENIKILVNLVFGCNWQILTGGLLIMLALAFRNCCGITETGHVLYREERGFFVFLSSVAGFFHFADLMYGWIKGELVIVETEAVKDAFCAELWSVIIAMFLGLAIGVLFYTCSQFVLLHQARFIKRRYFLSHIRVLGNR